MKHILLTLIVLVAAGALLAHPPMKVSLDYDQAGHVLTVKYQHEVGDPAQHFIDDITVMLNGELMVTQLQHSQPGSDGGMVLYLLTDAKAGDKVEVKLECNKGGHKTGELTVE